MNAKELIEKFIELRDKKARLKAEYDEKATKVQGVMDQIEVKLLEAFSKNGINSLKTESGTAYESVRTSASVADKEAFLDYVKVKDEWALLDVRASKSAVEQFVSANDELPPGVNWRTERVVNIRRPA